MNRFFIFLFIGITGVVSSHQTFAQKEIPELWGQRVHDEAKVLSGQTVEYLEHRLKTFEDSTSNQIAILIVSSLEGETIEQYALRAAEKWKLGTKGNDNGIVLAVSIEDRKMRIEVGQGLEGPLPDAICNRIIRNEMAPSFRRGDYDTGVVAAIDAIMMAVKGEYKGTPLVDSGRKGKSGLGRIIFIIVIFLLFSFLRRGGRGGRAAGWSAGAGWFLGSGGGGNWGGGGGGGGGFSGGGGSFGGGGSSGSW